jgi:type IV secretion system protein VirD4
VTSAARGSVSPDIGTGRGRRLVLALLVDVVVGLACGARYAAARLRDHPNLGRALYVMPTPRARAIAVVAVLLALGAAVLMAVPRARRLAPLAIVGAPVLLYLAGRAYAPDRLFVWTWAYRHVPALMPVLRDGWVFGGGVFALLGVATAAAWHRPTSVASTDSHGSARWGSGDELRGRTGLMLARDRGGRLLRYSGDAHLLTIAPTRAGKGVGLVIPALLTCPDSVFVTDPKGENYRITSGRRAAMGQTVVALDPYHVVTSRSASLNPLDLLTDGNAEAGDDAWYLADLLVDPEDRDTSSAFWNESARALIAGVIMYVATSPTESQDRSLPRVRELLSLRATDFDALLAGMGRDTNPDSLVRHVAAQTGQLDERTRAGVLATAYSHTHFLDRPRLKASMRDTTVRFGERTTVYLVIPRRRTKAARRYSRLVVGTFLREVTKTFDRSGALWLALLDEVQNLGRLDPIEDEFTVAAGAGVRMWLIAQDIAGLRRAYPQSWESFISNADVTMLFGINDLRTAELVSKLTGDATIRVASENRSAGVSHGRNGGSQEGASASVSEHGRPLLFPDEARRLGRGEIIIFPRGAAPVRAARLDYRTDPYLAPLVMGTVTT